MCPITFEEALAATNPADSADKRETSARALMAGTAANEAYWQSRGTLEALQAKADGHGAVVRDGSGDEGVEAVAPAPEQPAIDSTAVDEPEVSAEDKLRAQLKAVGMTPEA